MLANFIGTVLVLVLAWVYFDEKIIRFYNYVMGLRGKYSSERFMEIEIILLQSDMLVKSVERKINYLYEKYELNESVCATLDGHLYWLLRECKYLNRLDSPWLMKKRLEQLSKTEEDRWNSLEDLAEFQSGITK